MKHLLIVEDDAENNEILREYLEGHGYTCTQAFSGSEGRLLFSLLFAIVFNWGVIGIAAAMCLDWVIRAVIFALRLKSGKWKEFKVI